jgi:hypothetical protein
VFSLFFLHLLQNVWFDDSRDNGLATLTLPAVPVPSSCAATAGPAHNSTSGSDIGAMIILWRREWWDKGRNRVIPTVCRTLQEEFWHVLQQVDVDSIVIKLEELGTSMPETCPASGEYGLAGYIAMRTGL